MLADLVGGARSSARFADTGSVVGRAGPVHWVVVDPTRHPLCVWGGQPSGRRAAALGAAVVTNGPMTGRRLLHRWKVTRAFLVVAVSVGGVAGIAVGAAVVRSLGLADDEWQRNRRRPARWLRPSVEGGSGFAAAAATAVALLGSWVPCGRVRGGVAGIDDRRDFDGEGPDHAWLGRVADAARPGTGGSIVIGDGTLPETVAEGTGGLVRLVRDHRVVSGGDLARLTGRRGAVAWGLVPGTGGADDAEGLDVVVVIGSPKIDVAGAAVLLQAMGARDAVATDPSASVLLVAGGDVLVGPPRWHRRRVQRYGLACVTAP